MIWNENEMKNKWKIWNEMNYSKIKPNKLVKKIKLCKKIIN